LSGRRAFRGATFAETTSALMRDEPPPIEGAPPALERLVRRCLEKRPGGRFRSARDLAFSLEALAAAPTSAESAPAAAGRAAAGTSRRSRTTLRAAGAALLGLLAG